MFYLYILWMKVSTSCYKVNHYLHLCYEKYYLIVISSVLKTSTTEKLRIAGLLLLIPVFVMLSRGYHNDV